VKEDAIPNDQLVSIERAITGSTNALCLLEILKVSFCPIALQKGISKTAIIKMAENVLLCERTTVLNITVKISW
jgi:hypothetical protein